MYQNSFLDHVFEVFSQFKESVWKQLDPKDTANQDAFVSGEKKYVSEVFVTDEDATKTMRKIIEEVAAKHGVTESTVQDACSRRLGISLPEFYRYALEYLGHENDSLEQSAVKHSDHNAEEISHDDVRDKLRNIRDN